MNSSTAIFKKYWFNIEKKEIIIAEIETKIKFNLYGFVKPNNL